MAQPVLATKHISDYSDASVADFETVQFMIDFMNREGYAFDRSHAVAKEMIASIDRVAWRAVSKRIPATRHRGSYKMDAESLIHEGMHGLVIKAYGGELRGRPRITLLAECLASCSLVYLFFAKTRELGEHPFSHWFVRDLRRISAITETPYERLVQKGMLDPFATYKKSVAEMDAIYNYLMRRLKNGNMNYGALTSYLRKKETMVCLHTLDFGNNVLYAQANCGFESSAEDLRGYREIKRMLRESKTFLGFLQALEKRA